MQKIKLLKEKHFEMKHFDRKKCNLIAISSKLNNNIIVLIKYLHFIIKERKLHKTKAFWSVH